MKNYNGVSMFHIKRNNKQEGANLHNFYVKYLTHWHFFKQKFSHIVGLLNKELYSELLHSKMFFVVAKRWLPTLSYTERQSKLLYITYVGIYILHRNAFLKTFSKLFFADYEKNFCLLLHYYKVLINLSQTRCYVWLISLYAQEKHTFY